MPTTTFILAAGAFVSALGALAWREHRNLRSARRGLLESCAGELHSPRITHGGDGFPRLSGRHDRYVTDVALIPDTMTIRRLPQLWLSVTVRAKLPIESGLAVLVRPSGNDFYSLTHEFDTCLAPPASLPWEISVRGEDERARVLLERLTPTLTDILSDPRVKEIAITRAGCRIVRQAAEGRRGEHLLLRQAMFDDAAVPAEQLRGVLDEIDQIMIAARAGNRTENVAA